MEIVLFEVGGIRYALPAPQVREIVRAVAIVPLPSAPPVIEGVIDVRGELVAVFDVRRRFGLPRRPVAETDHLIIATAGSRRVAVRADRALDLCRVEEPDLHDAATLAPGMPYVRGVVTLPDGIALVHDLQTFLDDREAQALDRALSAPAAGGAS